MYTPKQNITACEIMSNGRYIALALEGYKYLVTLKLEGPNVEDSETDEEYGLAENKGKVFELKESEVC